MDPESCFNVSQGLLSTSGQVPVEIKAPTSWIQTIPAYMPWSTSQECSLNSDVMKFTAEPSFLLNPSMMQPSPFNVDQGMPDLDNGPRFQQKRKGFHLEENCPFTNKIHISEERMVARMNDLYISNNNPSVSSTDDTSLRNADVTNVNELTRNVNDLPNTCLFKGQRSNQQPMLILAPELRKLQKTDAILPSSILKTLKKPSMELVLWKPPGGVVDEIIKNAMRGTDCETTGNARSKAISSTKTTLQRIPQNLQPTVEQRFLAASTSSIVLASEDENMDVT